MRRLYVEIPEPAFREAARRALDERRSTRDQVGYDLERLYASSADRERQQVHQPAEASQ